MHFCKYPILRELRGAQSAPKQSPSNVLYCPAAKLVPSEPLMYFGLRLHFASEASKYASIRSLDARTPMPGNKRVTPLAIVSGR